MAFPLLADAAFDTVFDLTAGELLRRGIRGLLVDLDNTLAPYLQPDPDEAIQRWVRDMERGGVRVLIFSNNHEPRVARFSAPLGCKWLSEAGKPKPEAYEKGLCLLGLAREETAAVGDQIFTDTIGARRFGMRMLLVRPVRLKGYPLYALRRVAELPFVWLTHRGFREEQR